MSKSHTSQEKTAMLEMYLISMPVSQIGETQMFCNLSLNPDIQRIGFEFLPSVICSHTHINHCAPGLAFQD